MKIRTLIKKIEEYTDNNDHTQSVIELATFLNDKESLDQLIELQAKHIKKGYMLPDWIVDRNFILDNLLAKCAKQYTCLDYQDIRSAF